MKIGYIHADEPSYVLLKPVMHIVYKSYMFDILRISSVLYTFIVQLSFFISTLRDLSPSWMIKEPGIIWILLEKGLP